MSKKANTCADQNQHKKYRKLNKAKRRLAARQRGYVPLSTGGHACHKPGSMKVR